MKKCSLVLFMVAIICSLSGIIVSFASNSDSINVNGTEMKLGEQFEVSVNMSKCDKLLSGCVGNVSYDNKILDIVEVTDVYENIIYSRNSSSVKFATAEAVNGISFPEKTQLMRIKFSVKSTDRDDTNIGHKMVDMYCLDNNMDVNIDNKNDLLSVEIKKSGNDSVVENDVNNNVNNETEEDSEMIVNTGDTFNLKAIILFMIASICTTIGLVIRKKKNLTESNSYFY